MMEHISLSFIHRIFGMMDLATMLGVVFWTCSTRQTWIGVGSIWGCLGLR